MDLISRQAAIDAVLKCYDNNELFEVYERELQELPSAQPKRKRGKWIKIEHTWSGYECSVCGDVPYMQTCIGKPMYDFCPYCGAKMER